MIIDSHHHLWRYDPVEYDWIDGSMEDLRRDFIVDELDVVLAENGVDGSVVIQARQSRDETDWLLSAAVASDRILGVVGWLDLCAADFGSQLGEYEGRVELKGLRHVLQGEQDRSLVLRQDFQRGLKSLAESGLGYDMLIFPDQLTFVEEACQRVPELRCVLDHAAKPRMTRDDFDIEWARGILSLARNTDILCKVSGLVTEAATNASDSVFEPYLDHLLEHFGQDRLMFGSDWPVCLLRRNYCGVKSLIENYESRRGIELNDQFWGLNAVGFYDLNVHVREPSAGS